VLKKYVLSSFLNMAGLAAIRMSGGSEFHAAGPACEKARSPNLVHSRGVTYLLLEADCSQYVLLRCWTYGLRVSTTPGNTGNTGNILEFEIPPGNTGNLLDFC